MAGFLDEFDSPNGTLLNVHNPAWIQQSGDISTATCENDACFRPETGSSTPLLVYYTGSATDISEVALSAGFLQRGTGPAIRMNGTTDYYHTDFQVASGTDYTRVTLYKNGTALTQNTSVVYDSNTTLVLRLVGVVNGPNYDLEVFVNGNSEITFSDAAPLAAGSDGMRLTNLSTGEISVDYFDSRDFTPPSLTAPTLIEGDNASLAYSGSQLSTTAPMRVQFSNDGYATTTEREIPTTHTDNSSGTIEWLAGAEQAAAGTGGQGLGVPYTQGGWEARLVMLNEAGDADVPPLDISHLIKNTGTPNIQEFSAGLYNGTGNGRLKPVVSLIGDNDQLYHDSNQETGGSPTPLTLDFVDPSHPGPAYVGGDTEAYTGPLNYAWYATDALKWVYMRAAVVPAPAAQSFSEEFTEEFT